MVDDVDAGFALENQTRPVYSPVFWEFGFGDFVRLYLAAAAVVGYRTSSAVLFRDPQLSLLAERVKAQDAHDAVTEASEQRFRDVAETA